ncbi:hypothetical protein L596_027119 [Steinernema carpocapsae]|uniref:Secreted protein n=1 Tax=Steinernema carpocapsae TaxID=34508 RepID=A0A4U5M3E2_STECR|nr:hypothetical protein L596_027119 [Steinernema carpocapsae]
MPRGLFFLSLFCLFSEFLALTCDDAYSSLESYVYGLRGNIDSILEKSCNDLSRKAALYAFYNDLFHVMYALQCQGRYAPITIDSSCNALVQAYEGTYSTLFITAQATAYSMCQQHCPTNLFYLITVIQNDILYVQNWQ